MVPFPVLFRSKPLPGFTPNPFRFRTSATPQILHNFGANKSFRIRSYGLHARNPFGIRSYRKGGRGVGSAKFSTTRNREWIATRPGWRGELAAARRASLLGTHERFVET